jgi:hypothetical protein
MRGLPKSSNPIVADALRRAKDGHVPDALRVALLELAK